MYAIFVAVFFSLALLTVEACLPFSDLDGKAEDRLRFVLGGNISIEDELSNGNTEIVTSEEDLLCLDFKNCRWYNGRGNNGLRWRRSSGTMDSLRLKAITGTSVVPKSPYIIVATPVVRQTTEAAAIISGALPCQAGDGEIRFKYWLSPSVQISVCTRLVGSTKFLLCDQPIFAGSPGPAFLRIKGPINQPFEIVVMADHFIYNDGVLQGGFAIIDDIEYHGRLCKKFTTNNKAEVLSAGKSKEVKGKFKERLISSSADEQVCQLLSCNFSHGVCPQYKTTQWDTAKGVVGNPVTGIRGDASSLPFNASGHYLYVEGPTDSATLETLSFSLPSPVYFKFAYHQASVGTTLFVFAQRLGSGEMEKLFQSPQANVNSRKWLPAKMYLSAGEYGKLIFQAEDVPAHGYVGIDELILQSQDQTDLC